MAPRPGLSHKSGPGMKANTPRLADISPVYPLASPLYTRQCSSAMDLTLASGENLTFESRLPRACAQMSNYLEHTRNLSIPETLLRGSLLEARESKEYARNLLLSTLPRAMHCQVLSPQRARSVAHGSAATGTRKLAPECRSCERLLPGLSFLLMLSSLSMLERLNACRGGALAKGGEDIS
jgi:hypothetical protein